jgi:hypothetical protein
LPNPTSPSSIEENEPFTRGDGYSEDSEDHGLGCVSVANILLICYVLCFIVGAFWISFVAVCLSSMKESPCTTSSYNFNQTGPLSCRDVELGGGAPVPNPPMQPPPNNNPPTPHPNNTSAALFK